MQDIKINNSFTLLEELPFHFKQGKRLKSSANSWGLQSKKNIIQKD